MPRKQTDLERKVELLETEIYMLKSELAKLHNERKESKSIRGKVEEELDWSYLQFP